MKLILNTTIHNGYFQANDEYFALNLHNEVLGGVGDNNNSTAHLKLSRSHKCLHGVGVFIKDLPTLPHLSHLPLVLGGEAGDGLSDEKRQEDGGVEGDHVMSDKDCEVR